MGKTGCDADGQDTVHIGDALKCGCGILIERVTGADSCARQALLSEVLPMVAHWSRHPFAHQVVTTFLVTGSSVHCRQIAEKLSRDAASRGGLASLKPRFYGACLVRPWREACEPRQVWLQGHPVSSAVLLVRDHRGKSLSLRLAEERQVAARSRGHMLLRSVSY